jgi:hypothetical protein
MSAVQRLLRQWHGAICRLTPACSDDASPRDDYDVLANSPHRVTVVSYETLLAQRQPELTRVARGPR